MLTQKLNRREEPAERDSPTWTEAAAWPRSGVGVGLGAALPPGGLGSRKEKEKGLRDRRAAWLPISCSRSRRLDKEQDSHLEVRRRH